MSIIHERYLRFAVSLLTLFFVCCVLASPAEAQQPAAPRDVEVNISGVKVMIPDLVLRDHEGRKVRFYSDLIKDKVVVLTFFYTSCVYTCTMQGKTFSELQSLLGERLGKSVFLVSVTIDPRNDSPKQLQAWANRYKVRPGWSLVTGEEAEMNKLLVRFTGSTSGSGMHLPSTFIGNDKGGLWTSAVGFFAADDLLKVVNYITRDETDRQKH